MLPSAKFRPEVVNYLHSSLCNEAAKRRFGDDYLRKFNNLLSSLSWPPSFTTVRLHFPSIEDSQLFRELKEQLGEQYLRKHRSFPVIKVHPLLPDCLVIENHGPCSVVPVEQEVIVDAACGMAVLRGADIFIQGIMAASPGVHEGDTVSVYVDIDGLCRKGLTKRFDGSKLFIGNGVAAVSRQDIFSSGGKIRCGVGVTMTDPLFVAPSLSEVASELVFPQNLPSIVCVHVLCPLPGETILDMCAAPGGKTTHVATLMKGTGRVVALDKSKNKIKKLNENIARWKLNNVEVYCYDGTTALDMSVNAASCAGPPYPPEFFDRILLDAPCSGLGQRPTAVNNVSLAEVTSYPPLQKRLFEKAVALLKYGGVLVYSTCTITVEENESIVAWALRRFPDLKLDAQDPTGVILLDRSILFDTVPHLAGSGWPCPDLDEESTRLVQRFNANNSSMPPPSVQNTDVCSSLPITCDTDTIGFFIAKFVKRRVVLNVQTPQ